MADASFGVEHRVGYPAGGWFNYKLVDAQLDATGRFIRDSMMCETLDGGSEPCYTGSTLTAEKVYLGRTLPLYEGAFSATLTLFDNIRLYGLVDR